MLHRIFSLGLIISTSLVGTCALADATAYTKLDVGAISRGTQDGGRDIPLTAYHELSLFDLPKDARFESSLRTYHLFDKDIADQQDTDLHAATLILPEIGRTRIQVGRQPLTLPHYQGIGDGGEVDISLIENRLSTELFADVTRSIEEGDFNGPKGLVSGGRFVWTPNRARVAVGGYYRRDNLTNSDWETNATAITTLSAYVDLLPKKLDLLANAAYDTAGKTIEYATLGLGATLSPKWHATVSGNRYDVSRTRSRSSILSLFTADDLWQGSTGISFVPTDNWTLSTGYDLQRFSAGQKTRYGHLANASVSTIISPIHTTADITYRFLDSFGGRAHDVGVDLDFAPFDWASLYSSSNITKYTKVTNNNDTAFSTILGTTMQPLAWMNTDLFGELLKNDAFANEWRVGGVLSITLDHTL